MKDDNSTPGIRVGKLNRMEVSSQTDAGFEMAIKGSPDDGTKVILSALMAPDDCEPGLMLDVFVYPENDGRLVATCNKPNGQVDEFAVLKAINITRAGAFMDWGFEKDLLVPISQQITPMKLGSSYMVYIHLDPHKRVIGSTKIHRFFNEFAENMAPGDPVEAFIVHETPLGFKAVINGTHLGLFYKNEKIGSIQPGDEIQATIKTIREDGKIDLSFQVHNKQARQELTDRILEFLKANDGMSTLTDYSPPQAIYKQYGVSKGSYKKALGALYKKRLIKLSKESVTLLK